MKTALEWLEDTLYPYLNKEDKEYTDVLFNKAKEMEKEQTIDFAFNALKIADNTMNGYVDVDKLYEQKYGGNK